MLRGDERLAPGVPVAGDPQAEKKRDHDEPIDRILFSDDHPYHIDAVSEGYSPQTQGQLDRLVRAADRQLKEFGRVFAAEFGNTMAGLREQVHAGIRAHGRCDGIEHQVHRQRLPGRQVEEFTGIRGPRTTVDPEVRNTPDRRHIASACRIGGAQAGTVIGKGGVHVAGVPDQATLVQPDHPVADARDLKGLVGDKNGGAVGADFSHLVEALEAEGQVADGQDLIEDEHVGAQQVHCHGEAEADLHAGGITLHR